MVVAEISTELGESVFPCVVRGNDESIGNDPFQLLLLFERKLPLIFDFLEAAMDKAVVVTMPPERSFA